MRRIAFLGTATLALGLVACSDGDGADDGGGGGGHMINAAEGGTVEVQGAKLTIPAGALADDTTLTVTLEDSAGLPDESLIAGSVYDFGPDGLEFLIPVTLEMTFDSSQTPAEMVASIAFLENDAWQVLADSAVDGDTVTATTKHFTPFTVIFTGTDCAGDVCGDGCCTDAEDACGCPADCGVVCGDGCCGPTEDEGSCPADCVGSCGNGVCGTGGDEDACSCPADCPPVCGDDCCSEGEYASCPADCPGCGDAVCGAGETACTCPLDCFDLCGDGCCSGAETNSSCPTDCP